MTDTPNARTYTLRSRNQVNDSSSLDTGGRKVQSKKQGREAEEVPKAMKEFPTLKEATNLVTPQANKRHKKDSQSSTSYSRRSLELDEDDSSDDDDVTVKGGNASIHLNLTTRCMMKIRFANHTGKCKGFPRFITILYTVFFLK